MRINLRAVVCSMLLSGISSSLVHAGIGNEGNSTSVLFNKGWLFSRFGQLPDGTTRKESRGMELPAYSDTGWRALDLPHDWGIEGPFRKDLPSSTGKLPWTGIGWYRKHFRLSSTEKGKLFFIDFDGAMSHAQVWLNGKYIGAWPYGYASFRLQLTHYLHFDKENVLAVRLENPSNSSRWYPGSGIYRNVWLTAVAPVHIAHWGTFITTPSVKQEEAKIHIRTEIENAYKKRTNVGLKIVVTECGSNAATVAHLDPHIQIVSNHTSVVESDLTVTNPKLWSPDSPHLYQANIYIQQGGRNIDSTVTVFGIRTVRFTADSGLLLNGARVQIKGVCNHHDLGILGTAVNDHAIERQIRLLQEFGCNAIRTSHNPPAPELLNLCDRMGMMVLDEAFDCWKQGKTPNDYSMLFRQWHKKDIRALVRRDRNHPCVIGWSAGNEVREQQNGILMQQLKKIFKSEDPTRQVTAGCDKPDAGFDGFQNAVDMFGYNYKPHLYAKFHAANPSKPLYGSETASCVSTNGEYFFPVSDDKSKGAFNNQVSSYDLYAPYWATSPDVEFRGQDSNTCVAGEFVWTGFDYLGEPAPYMEDTCVARSSFFGILDLCGFKKDRFYLYQSRWKPDLPMAHILPHWNWPDRIGKITPVHVYTSGDEAELFLNGKSLGMKKKGPFEYRLRWDSVTYEPGLLKVIAYKKGKEWAIDSVRTTGSAARINLTVENRLIQSDGSDLAFITAQVVDVQGLKVPTASDLIQFKIEGPGTIVAVGNADPTCYDSFQSDRYHAFHGQCLAILRSVEGKNGLIHITAKSDILTSNALTVQSK